MTPTSRPQSGPTLYQIKVKGHLPDHWSDWFDEMTLTLDAERGETTLSGPVVDQAALYGLLNKVHDLGLTLLAVNRVQSDQE
jgi:hypothetical protein